MNQMTLTQSRAPDHVIHWTNSHSSTQYMDFVKIFSVLLELSSVYFDGCELLTRSCWFVLECHYLFSGVQLRIRPRPVL